MSLPWADNAFPLMLAPMQGVTNRALRQVFAEWVQPDVVFTEFVRVRPGAHRTLSSSDELEIRNPPGNAPLIVQLIGSELEALQSTAVAAQKAGVAHLNLNMGCPFGRMSSRASGGGLLRDVEKVPQLLQGLRKSFQGTFSVKLRAGFVDPREIFSLLPVFERFGVDFLIVHPRTVEQKYLGTADHRITAEVVRQTRLPVIANGDIRCVRDAERVRELTQAAGLMLGRGAMADPLLFKRIRGAAEADPGEEEKKRVLSEFLLRTLPLYEEIFCGEVQVLNKLKGVLNAAQEETLAPWIKKLQKTKTIPDFRALLENL